MHMHSRLYACVLDRQSSMIYLMCLVYLMYLVTHQIPCLFRPVSSPPSCSLFSRARAVFLLWLYLFDSLARRHTATCMNHTPTFIIIVISYSEFARVTTRSKFGRVRAIVGEFGRVWASQSEFGRIEANLDEIGRVWQS